VLIGLLLPPCRGCASRTRTTCSKQPQADRPARSTTFTIAAVLFHRAIFASRAQPILQGARLGMAAQLLRYVKIVPWRQQSNCALPWTIANLSGAHHHPKLFTFASIPALNLPNRARSNGKHAHSPETSRHEQLPAAMRGRRYRQARPGSGIFYTQQPDPSRIARRAPATHPVAERAFFTRPPGPAPSRAVQCGFTNNPGPPSPTLRRSPTVQTLAHKTVRLDHRSGRRSRHFFTLTPESRHFSFSPMLCSAAASKLELAHLQALSNARR